MATLTLPTPTPFEFGRVYQTPLDGELYTFTFQWNDRANIWYMTIGTNGNIDLVRGMAMYVKSDFLRPYKALAVPKGALSVVDSSGAGLDPQVRTDFGDRVQLQYAEVDAA